MCADFSRFAFNAEPSAASVLTKRSAPDSASKTNRAVKPVTLQHKNVTTSAPGVAAEHGLSELYRSPDSLERPLKLLIVGHNPSHQSWAKGHYYANPNNRMWFLLQKAGIVPAHFKAAHDKQCPDTVGLGFTDVMSGVAESQSCKITDATIKTYKSGFYKRLLAHLERVCFECAIPIEDAYPRVIAFSGVRQWKALFPNGYFDENAAIAAASKNTKTVLKGQALLTHMFANYKHTSDTTVATSVGDSGENGSTGSNINVATETRVATSTATTSEVIAAATAVRQQCNIPYGVQTARPEGWPALLGKSIVYLLPSSSGAAAMSNEEREGPYVRLGELLKEQYTWVAGAGLVNSESGVAVNRVKVQSAVADDTVDGIGGNGEGSGDGNVVGGQREELHQSQLTLSPAVRNSTGTKEVISLLSSPEDQPAVVYDLVSD